MPEILSATAIIKAINGGKPTTLNSTCLMEGEAEECQEATATPSVMPIKKEPAWLIKMAICKPSLPYNNSKIGKPINEVLLIPPVMINAATDLAGYFFSLPIKTKKIKATAKIIQATSMGNMNLLLNLNVVIWCSINAGINKLTNS